MASLPVVYLPIAHIDKVQFRAVDDWQAKLSSGSDHKAFLWKLIFALLPSNGCVALSGASHWRECERALASECDLQPNWQLSRGSRQSYLHGAIIILLHVQFI